MASFEPVEHDPFAAPAPPAPAAAPPSLVPVDHDPFAAAAPAKDAPPPFWNGGTQIANGMTFGFLPDILATSGGIVGAVRGALDGTGAMKGASEGYFRSRDNMRAERDAYRRDNPVMGTLHDVAGGVVTGAGAAKAGLTLASPNAGLVARGLLGGAEGSAYGGLSAFGNADGSVADRANAVPGGMATGAALGFALPVFTQTVSPLTGTVTRGITAYTNPVQSAEDLVLRKGLQPDKLTPQQISDQQIAAAAMGKPLAPADAGYNTSRVGAAIAKTPGEGRNTVRDFVAERNAGAQERVAGDVKDMIGRGATADATDQALIAQRKATAQADYDAAYRAPTPQGPIYARLLQIPSVQKALGAVRAVAAEGNTPISDVIDATTGTPTVRGWDMIKQALDDDVSGNFKGGQNTMANAIKQTRDMLKSALSNDVPAYGQALRNFSSATESREAIEAGRNLVNAAGSGGDAAVREFRALSPGEQYFARIGAAREVLASTETTQGAVNPGRAVAGSPDKVKRLRALFDDPAQADEFLQRMATERQMNATGQRMTGGSPTAENLADQANIGGLHHLTQNGADGILSRVLSWAGSRLTGITEQSAAEAAKILTSTDPNVILRLNSAITRQDQAKLGAALARAGFLRGVQPLATGAAAGVGDFVGPDRRP